MKKNLITIILSALLCINAVPAHAVRPSEPLYVSLGSAIGVSLIGPIGCACFGPGSRSFETVIKDPKLWKGWAGLGLAYGALGYYVLSKYTPQAKYDYAVKVKKDLEKHPLYACKNKCGPEVRRALREYANSLNHDTQRLPFVDATIALFKQHVTLKKAQTYLIEAVSDMPGDSTFEEQCAKLGSEIDVVLLELEKHIVRIVCTTEWVEDFGSSPAQWECAMQFLYGNIPSINEIINMVHTQKPDAGISTRNISIFFTWPFISSLEDWSEASPEATMQIQQEEWNNKECADEQESDIVINETVAHCVEERTLKRSR